MKYLFKLLHGKSLNYEAFSNGISFLFSIINKLLVHTHTTRNATRFGAEIKENCFRINRHDSTNDKVFASSFMEDVWMIAKLIRKAQVV